MTAVVPETSNRLSEQQLGLLMQYTVEAYKTFEKFAESLPNPLTRNMFKQFALDERANRELIDMKISAYQAAGIRVTVGGDQMFQEMLEGDMSFREQTEFLISREKTIAKRISDLLRVVRSADRNLLIFLAATKKSHIAELEREAELIKGDADWFKREDAEWRIVYGPEV